MLRHLSKLLSLYDSQGKKKFFVVLPYLSMLIFNLKIYLKKTITLIKVNLVLKTSSAYYTMLVFLLKLRLVCTTYMTHTISYNLY